MEYLVDILVPIACGCVLPIMIVWLAIRKKMNEANNRMQIVLAAIEKNPDMNVEELMKSMAPKKRLLKEKLLSKLLWGCIATLLGIGMIGLDVFFEIYKNSSTPLGVLGVASLAVGIAFLVSYFVGKKLLAKEIEAEQNQISQQA